MYKKKISNKIFINKFIFCLEICIYIEIWIHLITFLDKKLEKCPMEYRVYSRSDIPGIFFYKIFRFYLRTLRDPRKICSVTKLLRKQIFLPGHCRPNLSTSLPQ